MKASGYLTGEKAFAILMAMLSAFLLYSIPEETKWFNGMGISKQPRFWPAMCIVGLSVFTFFYGLSVWIKANALNSRDRSSVNAEISEMKHWLRPAEFVVYFLAYVIAVPWLGYLLATLIYFLLMTWRMGYRNKYMLWVSVATGLLIVLVFKTLLQVKVNSGAWYDLLPDAWATFMIINF
ncbi:MAG TPA: hypothetical protein DE045_08705 [Oceanospirillaceae bacterium]|nr:hypothetical protein [Oceanospirillaceae bacterium]